MLNVQGELTGMNSQHIEAGTTVPSEQVVALGAALTTAARVTRERMEAKLKAMAKTAAQRRKL